MNDAVRKRDLGSRGKLKLMMIPANLLFDILHNSERGRVFCWAAANEQLPEDVVLFGVEYDIGFHCFSLLIGSESFPEVPPGCEVERIGLLEGSIKYLPAQDVIQQMIHDGETGRMRETPGVELRSAADPGDWFRQIMQTD